MRARRPLAIIVSASDVVSAPNSGKIGVSPVPASCLFAIPPDVFEKEIAERNVREPFADGARDGGGHRALVDLIGTRRRNRHGPQRQAERAGLRFEHFDPHRMHRHSVARPVDGRQQCGDLDTQASMSGSCAPATRCLCRSTTKSSVFKRVIAMKTRRTRRRQIEEHAD